jgi:hypothetical protein
MLSEEDLRLTIEIIEEGQWSGQRNTSCSCHPVYVSFCPECGELELVPRDPNRCSSGMMRNEHSPNCARMQILKKLVEEYNSMEGEGYSVEDED